MRTVIATAVINIANLCEIAKVVCQAQTQQADNHMKCGIDVNIGHTRNIISTVAEVHIDFYV